MTELPFHIQAGQHLCPLSPAVTNTHIWASQSRDPCCTPSSTGRAQALGTWHLCDSPRAERKRKAEFTVSSSACTDPERLLQPPARHYNWLHKGYLHTLKKKTEWPNKNRKENTQKTKILQRKNKQTKNPQQQHKTNHKKAQKIHQKKPNYKQNQQSIFLADLKSILKKVAPPSSAHTKKIEKGSSSLKLVTHNSLAQTNGRKWPNTVIKTACIY